VVHRDRSAHGVRPLARRLERQCVGDPLLLSHNPEVVVVAPAEDDGPPRPFFHRDLFTEVMLERPAATALVFPLTLPSPGTILVQVRMRRVKERVESRFVEAIRLLVELFAPVVAEERSGLRVRVEIDQIDPARGRFTRIKARGPDHDQQRGESRRNLEAHDANCSHSGQAVREHGNTESEHGVYVGVAGDNGNAL